ncbi:MAG: hypothetical protein IKD73_02075, partial [Selenomonadaceae bacterium]|nr:hypothetical protein [Selenomonadaceae bacterium]
DDDDDTEVIPVDPTEEDVIKPIKEEEINTEAVNEDGTIDETKINAGDIVTTADAQETATEVLKQSQIDTTEATVTVLYATTSTTTSSGTNYTQITGVAGVRIKATSSGSGTNANFGSGSKRTRLALSAAANIDVMFEYDSTTNSYSTDPTQIRAKNGSAFNVGGTSGLGISVSDSSITSGPAMNVSLENGKPSLLQIFANAVLKIGSWLPGDVLYDTDTSIDGVTITFDGFDSEDVNTVTPDGKKVGTIDIANTEDATVNVDGSYAYTFAMHDSDGNSISSDAFELKYADDGDYTFTVLENNGINLDLADVVAKDGKTLSVVAAGGADQIIPPTAASGGEIAILGTTYDYMALANSESYFTLTDGAVTGFVLGTEGDRIVLDDSSSFAVYDINDLETNLIDDITFSGGELAITKDSNTTTGYSIGYYFDSVDDTITLTEDTVEGFEMFYQSKKVPYNVGEPVISNGGYTVTMTGKDQFTISDLTADATVTTVDGVTVEFENEGGSVILAATTNSDLTATLTIAGVTTEGAVTFEDATNLFANGITINGSTVQIADVDGDLTYNADGTIVVDDTVYAIGDGTYYGYEIAGDADGTVKLTLDSDGKVTAITDLNSGSAMGDFTSVTVNDVAIQTDDTSLVVTGNSDATGIDAISGLDSGKNITLNGGGTLNINGVAFGYLGEEETVVVTGAGAEEGIASVTGIASGDTITIADDNAIVVLPTDGDEAEVTVNGVKYTFTGDASNVSIDGAGNVGGLDEDAQLVVEGKTGTIYVNGTSGLDVTKTIVGTYDGTQARVVDSSNPIVNKNTSVSEVEEMLGLSYSGTQVVAQTSASDLDYTDAGEKKKVTLGQGEQVVTFGEYGKNEVVVASDSTGDKLIHLGTKGDAVIVKGSDTDSTVNVIGGAGADSIVVQDKAPVEFDMSKGGADKVITFASSNAKVTLDNYDINSGGGLVVHEAAASDIADAIDDGLIQFSGNKIVEVYRDGNRAADITVNNKSGNPSTMINLFNTEGENQKVGFTGTAGGTLDASSISDDLILIGNRDGNKTGSSSLTAGSGDDTIYAGDGDRVDAGAGINTVNLGGLGGSTVVANQGFTTINNLISGKLGDVLAIDSAEAVSFDGSNLIIAGSNYAVSASVATDLTGEDYVNQLFEISGQTVEAAIASTGKDITVSDDYDVPDYFLGNGGVSFKDYTGEVVIDAKGGWKTTEIGGKEVKFSNTLVSVQGGAGTTQLKGYEADDIFAAGSGITSLYGGAGNNTLIGYNGSDKKGPTEFFVIGNENGAKHTIQNFQFGTDFINTDYASNDITKVTVDGSGSNVILTVTNRNTGASETATIEGAVNAGNIKIGGLSEGTVAVGQVGSAAVTVDGEANYLAATVAGGATVNVSSALNEKTAIWLDNRGDKWFSDNFAVIDASNSTAEVTLAGDAKANTIYGGAGNASLWGGSGNANDLLVGGTARNSFYYEQGNGSDTISNANDGDVINLFDTSLENITQANITSGGVVLNFNNGGSIQVNSNAAVDYRLADGTTFNADHNTGKWVQKS